MNTAWEWDLTDLGTVFVPVSLFLGEDKQKGIRHKDKASDIRGEAQGDKGSKKGGSVRA